MPILRLHRTQPTVAVVDVVDDMTLDFTSFDGIAYNFDWTGRGGLLPLAAVARAINPRTRARMIRSVWIFCDASTFGAWAVGDVVSVLSSRLGSRTSAALTLSQEAIKLPVICPYDRISFQVGAQPPAPGGIYNIDIVINTLDEGDVGYPEVPVTP